MNTNDLPTIEKQCTDCGEPFIITSGERKFLRARNLTEFFRCPDCRKARKIVRERDDQGAETRILMLTRHGEYHHVQELLRAGANGYVLKQSSSEELLQAIRVVASGKSFLDPLVAEQITQHYAADANTHPRPIREEPTPRELEVLRLLARGYANREIAVELGISVKTVDAHKANGMSKLGMSSRIELVRFAVLQGWLRES